MGELESWHIHLHPLCRLSSKSRCAHIQSEVRQSRFMDSRTNSRTLASSILPSPPHTRLSFQSVQAMGNNRGRAVYEANMPAGFRRPQTDSYVSKGRQPRFPLRRICPRALETFIRSKYEQRKWIAKDWIPPEITVSSDVSVVLVFFSHRRTMCLTRLATGMNVMTDRSSLLFSAAHRVRIQPTTQRTVAIGESTGNSAPIC
jgi:hypothetical protein